MELTMRLVILPMLQGKQRCSVTVDVSCHKQKAPSSFYFTVAVSALRRVLHEKKRQLLLLLMLSLGSGSAAPSPIGRHFASLTCYRFPCLMSSREYTYTSL